MESDDAFATMMGSIRANAPFQEGDEINHPAHYNMHPSGIETIQITEYFNFCVGNAVKYLWRAGLKEGTEAATDLQKARWYVDRELKRLGVE